MINLKGHSEKKLKTTIQKLKEERRTNKALNEKLIKLKLKLNTLTEENNEYLKLCKMDILNTEINDVVESNKIVIRIVTGLENQNEMLKQHVASLLKRSSNDSEINEFVQKYYSLLIISDEFKTENDKLKLELTNIKTILKAVHPYNRTHKKRKCIEYADEVRVEMIPELTFKHKLRNAEKSIDLLSNIHRETINAINSSLLGLFNDIGEIKQTIYQLSFVITNKINSLKHVNNTLRNEISNHITNCKGDRISSSRDYICQDNQEVVGNYNSRPYFYKDHCKSVEIYDNKNIESKSGLIYDNLPKDSSTTELISGDKYNDILKEKIKIENKYELLVEENELLNRKINTFILLLEGLKEDMLLIEEENVELKNRF